MLFICGCPAQGLKLCLLSFCMSLVLSSEICFHGADDRSHLLEVISICCIERVIIGEVRELVGSKERSS